MAGQTLINPLLSGDRTSHRIIDDKVNLQQKLSAKLSKGKEFVETGLGVTEQIGTISESENMKTIVEAVVKFSNGPQSLASVLQVVRFLSSLS